MKYSGQKIIVAGGGLAGCEAAWQIASRGINVILYEMRPLIQTGAHITDHLAELVCSNSLGSTQLDRASGLIKEELRLSGSLLLRCAEETSLPAGGALAVDREAFSKLVTSKITHHPRIELLRQEVCYVPESPTVICTGPLTSQRLAESIASLTGMENLYFYDALAPIVTRDSIDMQIAFLGSRYNNGLLSEGDYINCPMTKAQYDSFVDALVVGKQISLREFENGIANGVTAGNPKYFEGCLPIEVIANRGHNTLSFGTLRPIGIKDPRNGKHNYAIVQLRQDNLAGSLYNLVGFQTNLIYPEQNKIFRMIPGLENAEFVRYGQMHRNTFIASPRLLEATLQFKSNSGLFFAGQITGVEGYMSNIATGLLAGINAVRFLENQPYFTPPRTTMIGALCNYIANSPVEHFQPMKANLGLLPPLENSIKSKQQRAQEYSSRSIVDMTTYIHANQSMFDRKDDPDYAK